MILNLRVGQINHQRVFTNQMCLKNEMRILSCGKFIAHVSGNSVL